MKLSIVSNCNTLSVNNFLSYYSNITNGKMTFETTIDKKIIELTEEGDGLIILFDSMSKIEELSPLLELEIPTVVAIINHIGYHGISIFDISDHCKDYNIIDIVTIFPGTYISLEEIFLSHLQYYYNDECIEFSKIHLDKAIPYPWLNKPYY